MLPRRTISTGETVGRNAARQSISSPPIATSVVEAQTARLVG